MTTRTLQIDGSLVEALKPWSEEYLKLVRDQRDGLLPSAAARVAGNTDAWMANVDTVLIHFARAVTASAHPAQGAGLPAVGETVWMSLSHDGGGPRSCEPAQPSEPAKKRVSHEECSECDRSFGDLQEVGETGKCVDCTARVSSEPVKCPNCLGTSLDDANCVGNMGHPCKVQNRPRISSEPAGEVTTYNVEFEMERLRHFMPETVWKNVEDLIRANIARATEEKDRTIAELSRSLRGAEAEGREKGRSEYDRAMHTLESALQSIGRLNDAEDVFHQADRELRTLNLNLGLSRTAKDVIDMEIVRLRQQHEADAATIAQLRQEVDHLIETSVPQATVDGMKRNEEIQAARVREMEADIARGREAAAATLRSAQSRATEYYQRVRELELLTEEWKRRAEGVREKLHDARRVQDLYQENMSEIVDALVEVRPDVGMPGTPGPGYPGLVCATLRQQKRDIDVARSELEAVKKRVAEFELAAGETQGIDEENHHLRQRVRELELDAANLLSRFGLGGETIADMAHRMFGGLSAARAELARLQAEKARFDGEVEELRRSGAAARAEVAQLTQHALDITKTLNETEKALADAIAQAGKECEAKHAARAELAESKRERADYGDKVTARIGELEAALERVTAERDQAQEASAIAFALLRTTSETKCARPGHSDSSATCVSRNDPQCDWCRFCLSKLVGAELASSDHAEQPAAADGAVK